MRRNVKLGDGLKIRVLMGVQLIGEKLLHTTSSKFTGRQTDVMDYQKTDRIALWALICVGGWALNCRR
jgi:hypothetical protein